MDSGNSDDQDLDPTSSFLNPSPNLDSISAPHDEPLVLTHQNPDFYYPQTRTHDHDQYHNDLIWSTGLGLRSDHDQHNYFANLGNSCGAITSSSSLTSAAQSESHGGHALIRRPDHQTGVIKNPKKRVRASNRAPTTVLKTDTANFRQMVQEFTGFPATSLQGPPYPQRPAASFFDTPVRPAAHRVFSQSLLNNPTAVDSVVSITSTLPMTDHVTAGATLCGSTSGDWSNNSPQPTNHLSNMQLQDRSIPSATQEMGSSDK